MAQADMFLKLEGVEGESQDHKHKGELEIQSWSWGATQSGSMGMGGGGGTGKVNMQDFHFVIKNGKHSPKLMLACATGQHIKSATLVCRKAGGDQQEYLKWTFTDIVISSYQIGHSAGSAGLPSDQCSFNYTKIEMEYKEQKESGELGGQVKAGYDVKANQKI